MERKTIFTKDFTLVVIGQIISLFGNGIIRFALPLYLLSETGSATLFGLVSALSFLPMILLIPIGGILADRVNKRNVMVVLDFVTAMLMAVFFLLLGHVNLIALLIVTLMLLFAISGTYQPTVQASIPCLQGKDNLMAANAIINQVSALAGLVAPMMGGVLFGMWGIRPIIIIGGICFFISAVMELFIIIPYQKMEGKQNVLHMVRQDIGESFAFIRHKKPVIFKCISIMCGFNLFLSAMLMVAMPVIITQTLGLSDKLYGFAQGILAAGGLFGGILVGILGKKLSMGQIHRLLLITAVLLLPIGFSTMLDLPPFISYLLIMVSCFFLMSVATMITVLMLTFIQGETPDYLVGKVVACAMALSMCSQPLGQALYGWLFDVFAKTPEVVVFAGATASAIIALVSKGVFAPMLEVHNEL